MLKLEHISKSFGDKVVLKDVNISIESGEVYGLIGKNGAGKTTLMNIISCIMASDGGEVFIDDKKILTQNDLSKKLCYIVDVPSGYEYLNAREYLSFIVSSQKLSKDEENKIIDFNLKLVNLQDTGKKLIKSFSRGMKQRLGIAAGLIFDPEIVMMDEPTSALDPEGRLEVLNIIQDLKSRGKTILLSTHILSDVERVCDKIGILSDGEIIVSGKTQDIKKKYLTNTIVVECPASENENIKSLFEGKDYITDFKSTNIGCEITYSGDNRYNIFKIVASNVKDIESIHIKRKSIEEIFIENTKGDLKNDK